MREIERQIPYLLELEPEVAGVVFHDEESKVRAIHAATCAVSVALGSSRHSIVKSPRR
jgi:hypothetical protein